MSFTVFSARSLANHLENAVGGKAFYFYMQEIIDNKLYEKYKDDVSGEECNFDGLLQFMQHKDGLGIKDLPLFEKCLGVVASSSHKMAQNAHWLKSAIQSERGKSSQEREAKTGRMLKKPAHDIIMDGQGTSSDCLLRRIARESPTLLSEIGKDKRLKSARAAAIEAGIITAFPSLQLKDPAPTAQKLLAKKGQAWCLQLLEELSELVL
jgi:hypothetical protein